MATLDGSFESDLKDALLDNAESEMVGQAGNVLHEFVQAVHDNLRDYGRRHGYDVESTIQSVQQPEVSRSGNFLSVTVGWESEQMARWEFGTSPHTIRGNPILSFVWEDPPNWVKQEFPQGRDTQGRFVSGWRVFFESVEHPGMPESRAIRDGLNYLRLQLEGEIRL